VAVLSPRVTGRIFDESFAAPNTVEVLIVLSPAKLFEFG
jgi:hypothetical protein